MELIKITWQTFNDGDNDEFNATYLNIKSVILKLENILLNSGIKIVLEKKLLPGIKNGENISSLNRVFIDGEPIKTILKNIPYEDKDEIPEHVIISAIFAKVREKMNLGNIYARTGP
ncbi:hypothetical protein DRN73_01400 [Candidatus Pacearchaeota archaeon]|nr:MAG: hypothetical protein DRN73_01400 [Candidatus Pacearchaeota archaeon]